jgi:hypothetical protein
MVDLMEMKEFLPPWLGWRRKQEREGLLECLRRGRRGGGRWVRWRVGGTQQGRVARLLYAHDTQAAALTNRPRGRFGPSVRSRQKHLSFL